MKSTAIGAGDGCVVSGKNKAREERKDGENRVAIEVFPEE